MRFRQQHCLPFFGVSCPHCSALLISCNLPPGTCIHALTCAPMDTFDENWTDSCQLVLFLFFFFCQISKKKRKKGKEKPQLFFFSFFFFAGSLLSLFLNSFSSPVDFAHNRRDNCTSRRFPATGHTHTNDIAEPFAASVFIR